MSQVRSFCLRSVVADSLLFLKTVYTRYFGQTIATDPLGRIQQDKNALSQTTLFKTWCQRFFTGDFVVHEFLDLRVELDAERFSSTTWLKRPDLWNREYMVAFAGCLGSMNSAPGGMPQVQVRLGSDILDYCRRTR